MTRPARADLRLVDVRPVPLPEMAAVETRNAAGVVWRRAWALPDRIVLSFPGIATLEATDDGAVSVDRELPEDLREHLVCDHVLPLLLARRGGLVLHGAVLALEGRGVVVIGPSGVGKSTFAASAWLRGWTLAGDDGALLTVDSGRARVEPTYPTLRLTPEAAQLLALPVDAGAPALGKRRLRTVGLDRDPQQAPTVLVLVAVLEPGPVGARAALTPLTGVDAHLALFGCTFYADLARGPVLRAIVDQLGDVAEAVGVARFVVPRGPVGLADAERLLRREVAA